jgi:hypothetical protein
MTSITVQAAASHVAGPVWVPRGALWAAGALLPLFRWLHVRGERAAARGVQTEQTRRVREAARVRRQAADWAASDPRILAELLAACDRHERGG